MFDNVLACIYIVYSSVCTDAHRTHRMRICVVGAGVVGLSCAVRLKEVFGWTKPITIISDKFMKDTTSDVAAGYVRITDLPKVSGYNGRRSSVER